MFKGPQTTGKENDFLLIYDPETKEFILEKHSTALALRNVRTGKRKAPVSDSDEDLIRRGALIMPKEIKHINSPSKEHDDGETFSDLEKDLLNDLQQS